MVNDICRQTNSFFLFPFHFFRFHTPPSLLHALSRALQSSGDWGEGVRIHVDDLKRNSLDLLKKFIKPTKIFQGKDTEKINLFTEIDIMIKNEI